MVKAGIDEYNNSYENIVGWSEEINFTQTSHLICYDDTHFQLTQKGTSTNTKFERTMRVSEGDTGEVLSIQYECKCTAVVDSKATVGPLPIILIFQGPMSVMYKYQWPHIDGFTSVLEPNACGRNYRAMVIKHYHSVLNT